jgi:MFS family permease
MTTDTKAADHVGIWATFRESPVAVKAVLGGVFVNKIGGFLNIFLVLYMTSLGFSADKAAAALTVYGAGAVIGALVGGTLAGRLGARNATVISMAGSAVLIASLLYLHSYPLLLAAVTLVGIVTQIYRPASATLLSDLTPDNRQVMIFAMYRFGLNLGTTAAPLIGFTLYYLDNKHYTLLFWGEATVALVYAMIALVALPRRTTPVTGEAAETSAEDTGSYIAVLRDRRYVVYLLAMFFNSVVYIQYLVTLPLDVHATGLKIFWYTLAVSLNGFIVIAFELLLTKISQKWPTRVTVGISFALVGCGVAVYGLPLVPAVIIIGTLIWTLGEIIGGPAVFAYPATAGPAYLKARYIGSFQFVFGLGSAVGPVIGAALFVEFGRGVWPLLAIGSLIAAVLGIVGVRSSSTTPQLPADSETDLVMDNAPIIAAE